MALTATEPKQYGRVERPVRLLKLPGGLAAPSRGASAAPAVLWQRRSITATPMGVQHCRNCSHRVKAVRPPV